MLYPSIDKLIKKADSKYKLVGMAARRARMLLDGYEPQIKSNSCKHVGVALEEIMSDIVVSYAKKNEKREV